MVILSIVDAENLINTLGMHEENAIEVPYESNVGTSASIDTRGQTRGGGSHRFSNPEGKTRQVGIDGDGDWVTTIEYLIEDMNTRPAVQLTITSGHKLDVVGSIPCWGKVSQN